MPPASSKVRSFFTRICFGPMPRKRDRRSPSVGGRPTGGKISAKPHPASVDLRDASLLPSKWSEKTYLYDSVIQLQAWLQYYCTNAARLLQFCCTAFAVLLHKPRSTAAKAVQQNCKGCAANVQRRGRKIAKARQPACGPIGPERASPKCSRR